MSFQQNPFCGPSCVAGLKKMLATPLAHRFNVPMNTDRTIKSVVRDATTLAIPDDQSTVEYAPDHTTAAGGTTPIAVEASFPKCEVPVTIGRYAIRKILGFGAYGAVYLAHDSELERLVALKVPRAGRFTDLEQIQQFIAEARTSAKLKHPRIVGVHDVQRQPDGTPVVVLDYIDGLTLRALLEQGKLQPQRAAELMTEISDAVAVAHQMGIIHRDLKPANILLDSSGHPHVSDFGLAVHEDLQRELKGQCAGTVAYMAPEQVRGESHRLDGRADIWALGVILYQMLSGRLPFGGSSFEQLSDEIQHREPKPPRQIDPTIPAELEAIITRCCAKNVTQRYSTATDLARDLQQWLTSISPLKEMSSAIDVTAASQRAPGSFSLNASCGVVSLALTASLAFAGITVWNLSNRATPDSTNIVGTQPTVPNSLPSRLEEKPIETPDSTKVVGTQPKSSGPLPSGLEEKPIETPDSTKVVDTQPKSSRGRPPSIWDTPRWESPRMIREGRSKGSSR